METSPNTPDKIHRYPCTACGADLVYEPKDGFLSCAHCGHKEAIPATAEQVQERSFEQYLQIRPEQLDQLAANALEVQCQSCGATVTFTPPEVARQCDFCGVQIVAQPKSADPILAPEGVLPFCICEELNLWHAVDPFTAESVTQNQLYFRLHGRSGWRYEYEEAELRELAALLGRSKPGAAANELAPYVFFNNARMTQDALRFQSILDECPNE